MRGGEEMEGLFNLVLFFRGDVVLLRELGLSALSLFRSSAATPFGGLLLPSTTKRGQLAKDIN